MVFYCNDYINALCKLNQTKNEEKNATKQWLGTVYASRTFCAHFPIHY